jgi:transcriptional regulator with XRE-family HTH domain
MEKPNISRIEAGRTNVTIKNLYKIAEALGVTMKEIVDIESEEKEIIIA